MTSKKQKYIFKAKTPHGHKIKNLANLLQCCLREGCFVIDSSGISLSQVDHKQQLFIDLKLNNESFFEYNCPNPYIIGLNISCLYKMLDTIKKKDAITLFMDTKNRDRKLGIRVDHPERKRTTTTYINSQKVQFINIEMPQGYDKSITISTNEYQKMCKDVKGMGKRIHLCRPSKNCLKFYCEGGGNLSSREVEFGGEDDDEFEDSDDKSFKKYDVEFETQQLTQLGKGIRPRRPHADICNT